MGAADKIYKEKRYHRENIRRIAEQHIRRFNNFLRIAAEEGNPRADNINVSECQMYQRLWTDILNAGGVWEVLTTPQKEEINMALFDEDPEDTENDA